MLILDEVFEILPKQIKTTLNCYIDIDRREYKETDIIETSNFFILPGILEFHFPDYYDFTSILLDYNVNLHKTNETFDDGKNIHIEYQPDDIVISQDKVKIVQKKIGTIQKLLEGRLHYIKDPKVSLNLLHKSLPTVDLVFLETLLSNMFYNENDELCRIKGKYKNCTVIGQTKLAKTRSWLSSIAFQHIDQGIRRGLISNADIEKNPIEQILLGEL